MKRTIAVIIFVVVIASMLSAAGIRPIQPLQGILQWERANVCGVSDYVSLPVMDKVYLTGNFKPTHGLFEGCTLKAVGSPYTLEGCKLFAVDQYTITCDSVNTGGHR